MPLTGGFGVELGNDSSSLELFSESDEPVLSFELWRICCGEHGWVSMVVLIVCIVD